MHKFSSKFINAVSKQNWLTFIVIIPIRRDRSVSTMTAYRRIFRCLIPEKGKTISLQKVQKAPGSNGTKNTAISGRHSSVLCCLTKQGHSIQNL